MVRFKLHQEIQEALNLHWVFWGWIILSVVGVTNLWTGWFTPGEIALAAFALVIRTLVLNDQLSEMGKL